MLYFVVFVLLSSISTPVVVDALSCATNCQFDGKLGSVTPPTCNYVDKPPSQQSCQVGIIIDYITGDVHGALNAKTPAAVANFDAVTVFSLAKEAAILNIQFDCLDSDKCDLAFVTNVLNSDWSKVLSQVKLLRGYLSDVLFNPNDLRPTDTCPSNQTCSGQGFCRTVYQVWSDVPNPVYEGFCSNSTDQPILDWIQAYDQSKVGIILTYTCNTPSCAASASAVNLTSEILRDYVLPFNVTIPSTSTIAPVTSTTATSGPASSTTTTVSTSSITATTPTGSTTATTATGSTTTTTPTGSTTVTTITGSSTATTPTGSSTVTTSASSTTTTVPTGSSTVTTSAGSTTTTVPTGSSTATTPTGSTTRGTASTAFLDKIVQVVSLFASFLFLYFS